MRRTDFLGTAATMLCCAMAALLFQPGEAQAAEETLAKLPEKFQRATSNVVKTEILYKEVGDRKLVLHVFREKGSLEGAPRAAIVMTHGGGLHTGDPSHFFPECQYLASRGMVCISVQYRLIKTPFDLSKEDSSPLVCVADAKSAIRYIRTNAKELNIDPEKIAGGGGSAGGYLSAATGLIEGYDEEGEDLGVSSVPNALILYYPGLDATLLKLPEKLSPFHQVSENLPAMIIHHGTADVAVSVERSKTFAQRVRDRGSKCELILYEDMPHAFNRVGRFKNRPFFESVMATDRFLVDLGYLQGEATMKYEDVAIE